MAELDDILKAIKSDLEAARRQFRNEPIPSSLLKELAEAAGRDSRVQLFLASYADVPAKVLEQLVATSDNEEVLCEVAAHPRTSRTALRELAEKGTPAVREMVAGNRLISPQAATVLSRDPAIPVRARLAANPGTPLRVLADLADDSSAMVRSALLKQRQLEGDIHERLLNDPAPLVRMRAVLLAPLGEQKMLEWADSDDLERQRLLLARKELPPAVLESLCFSPHLEIQKAAMGRRILMPDELLGWAEQGCEEVQCLVAGDLNLPEEIQAVLAKHPSETVRQALAGNPSLKESVVKVLLHDTAPVLAALASNPFLPEPLLVLLVQLNIPELNEILAERPALPQSVVMPLVARGEDTLLYRLALRGNRPEKLSHDRLQSLAQHRLPTFRALAASYPQLTRSQQAKLAHDPAPAVRRALAANPGLGAEAKTILGTAAKP